MSYAHGGCDWFEACDMAARRTTLGGESYRTKQVKPALTGDALYVAMRSQFGRRSPSFLKWNASRRVLDDSATSRRRT